MEANAEQRILRQLIWIKWSTGAIAFALLLVAGTVVWSFATMSADLASASADRSFSDKATELLEQGKEREVLASSAEREKQFPKDPNVYWFRGRALYQLGRLDDAIAAFSMTEALAPSWKINHTEPFISAIKHKLASVPSASGNPQSRAPSR